MHQLQRFIGHLIDYFVHHHPTYERIKQILGRIALPGRIRAILAIIGATVALLGFILPWYTIAYLPPSSLPTVNNMQFNARWVEWYNGFAQADEAQSLRDTAMLNVVHSILWAILLSFLCSYLYRVVRIFTLGRINRTTAIIRRLLKYIPGSIQFPIILSYLYVIFVRIGYGYGEYELRQGFITTWHGTKEAVQAAQYLTVHLSIGFYVLVFGFVFIMFGMLTPERPPEPPDMATLTELYITRNKTIVGLVLVLVLLVALFFGSRLVSNGTFSIVDMFHPVLAWFGHYLF